MICVTYRYIKREMSDNNNENESPEICNLWFFHSPITTTTGTTMKTDSRHTCKPKHSPHFGENFIIGCIRRLLYMFSGLSYWTAPHTDLEKSIHALFFFNQNRLSPSFFSALSHFICPDEGFFSESSERCYPPEIAIPCERRFDYQRGRMVKYLWRIRESSLISYFYTGIFVCAVLVPLLCICYLLIVVFYSNIIFEISSHTKTRSTVTHELTAVYSLACVISVITMLFLFYQCIHWFMRTWILEQGRFLGTENNLFATINMKLVSMAQQYPSVPLCLHQTDDTNPSDYSKTYLQNKLKILGNVCRNGPLTTPRKSNHNNDNLLSHFKLRMRASGLVVHVNFFYVPSCKILQITMMKGLMEVLRRNSFLYNYGKEQCSILICLNPQNHNVDGLTTFLDQVNCKTFLVKSPLMYDASKWKIDMIFVVWGLFHDADMDDKSSIFLSKLHPNSCRVSTTTLNTVSLEFDESNDNNVHLFRLQIKLKNNRKSRELKNNNNNLIFGSTD